MGYSYEAEKGWIFTDDGQRALLRVLDRARKLLEKSGAVRETELLAKDSGDTWKLMALVDRLVELGYIARVSADDVARQYTVYVASVMLKP